MSINGYRLHIIRVAAILVITIPEQENRPRSSGKSDAVPTPHRRFGSPWSTPAPVGGSSGQVVGGGREHPEHHREHDTAVTSLSGQHLRMSPSIAGKGHVGPARLYQCRACQYRQEVSKRPRTTREHDGSTFGSRTDNQKTGVDWTNIIPTHVDLHNIHNVFCIDTAVLLAIITA